MGLPARLVSQFRLALVVSTAATAVLAGNSPSRISASGISKPSPGHIAMTRAALAQTGVYFEPNVGQLDGGGSSSVQFLARGGGMTAFFTADSMLMQFARRSDGGPAREFARPGAEEHPRFESTAVRMRFRKGRQADYAPENPLASVSAYFLGNDESRWRSRIQHYSRIRARDVYEGVDIVYYGAGNQLEYDFVVKPGADPQNIELAFEGVTGVHSDRAGNLVLASAFGPVLQARARVYQSIGGKQVEIAASYRVSATGGVTFALGSYDRTRELVIDPVLSYSTFLGGAASGAGTGIAVDGSGNAYVVSINAGADYSTANALPPNGATFQGRTDVVVSKLVFNPSSNALSLGYATFLGGSLEDEGTRIAVDASGAAYVTGLTSSTNFPLRNAASPNGATNQGGGDVFLLKLEQGANNAVNLTYSTLFGGRDTESALDIAVDAAGTAYITGYTASADLPVRAPISQDGSCLQGTFDAFVTRFSFNGTTLSMDFSTYLGGAGDDGARSIAIDPSGAAYVSGSSSIPFGGNAFPLVNAIPAGAFPIAGNFEGFVSKLNYSSGTLSLVYSTLVRGLGTDQVSAVAVDSAGSAYIAGITSSTNMPVVNTIPNGAIYRGGNTDAFAAKLTFDSNSRVLAFAYLTYLGGLADDAAWDVAVDPSGTAYVTGSTGGVVSGAAFPKTDQLLPAGGPVNGVPDAFVTKLVFSGGALSVGYSILIGGAARDIAHSIALGPDTAVFISGTTDFSASPFPTANPISPRGATHPQGTSQVFAARLVDGPSVTTRLTVSKTGEGTVTSSGGNGGAINCGSTCTATVSGAVTLTAAPSSGWVVGSFSGACTATATNTCQLTVDGDKAVNVTFVQPGTVTVTKSGSGSGTVSGGGIDCGSVCSVQLPSSGSLTLTAAAAAGSTFAGWSGACSGIGTCTIASGTNAAAVTATFTAGVVPPPPSTVGLHFVPVTPCRLVDTRSPVGTFGAPALKASEPRDFPVSSGGCGIPSTARAYALNVTVVPKGPLPYLTVWPTGTPAPTVSTLNSLDGRIKANAAIVPAGANGSISILAVNDTELILDISGYFVYTGTNFAALAFYPLPPCRIADTRSAAGPFGGPALAAQTAREFRVPAGACNVPANAEAFSLNVTVVPSGPLPYLTIWPAGVEQPIVSTLNSLSGGIVANAAIVPAGTNGGVNVLATANSHVILDINGYFAPPGGSGALAFYTVNPCRVSDTRNTNGAFGGPVLAAQLNRDYAVPNSACAIPSVAKAYSMNATVVPPNPLPYLTLWPAGQAIPTVSTLNALDGSITSNAAIVVAGSNGSITAFGASQTHLILDINGFFAP